MNSGSSQTGQIRDALVRKDLCQLFDGIKTTIVVTVLRTVDSIKVLQADRLTLLRLVALGAVALGS